MREHFLAAAIALVTFGVVSGGIVGVGLATAPPAHAQVVTANLTGEWMGAYISADGGEVNRFDMKLQQAGVALSGAVTEANAFGNTELALFLTSSIAGTVRGDVVQFLKTYDGSGGESHTVTYSGRLDGTGRRIRGTYVVEGASGTFDMVR